MRQAAVKTKKELKSILVAERKTMREKAANSVFMRRTCSMLAAQKKRAEKLNRLAEIDYDLEKLRAELTQEWMMPWWRCGYCGQPVSVNKFCLDHMTPVSRGGSFNLSNLCSSCQPCNFQKGIMNTSEFEEFTDAIKNFPKDVQADIKRRLTIGGKWGVRV